MCFPPPFQSCNWIPERVCVFCPNKNYPLWFLAIFYRLIHQVTSLIIPVWGSFQRHHVLGQSPSASHGYISIPRLPASKPEENLHQIQYCTLQRNFNLLVKGSLNRLVRGGLLIKVEQNCTWYFGVVSLYITDACLWFVLISVGICFLRASCSHNFV